MQVFRKNSSYFFFPFTYFCVVKLLLCAQVQKKYFFFRRSASPRYISYFSINRGQPRQPVMLCFGGGPESERQSVKEFPSRESSSSYFLPRGQLAFFLYFFFLDTCHSVAQRDNRQAGQGDTYYHRHVFTTLYCVRVKVYGKKSSTGI